MSDAAKLPALVVIGVSIVLGWIAAGGRTAGIAAVYRAIRSDGGRPRPDGPTNS